MKFTTFLWSEKRKKNSEIFGEFLWENFSFFPWKSLIFDEFSPSIYFRGIFLEFLVIFFGWFLWQNKMKNVTKNRWKYRKKARIEARRGEVWKTAKLTLSRKLPVWLEGWPKINCLDYQKKLLFQHLLVLLDFLPWSGKVKSLIVRNLSIGSMVTLIPSGCKSTLSFFQLTSNSKAGSHKTVQLMRTVPVTCTLTSEGPFTKKRQIKR